MTKVDEQAGSNGIERRTHIVEMQVREGGYGKKAPVMRGYAANFNSISENLGGFREMLMPGCFSEALKTSDVRALFNHNPDKILGRAVSGTLRLSEDERGLMFEVDPPETSYAKDLEVSMRRGDISQCSFGFTVAEGGDAWRKEEDGTYMRSIMKVDKLFDVSPVTYPAYASTSCAVRSMELFKQDVEAADAKKAADKAEELRAIEMEQFELELRLAEVE